MIDLYYVWIFDKVERRKTKLSDTRQCALRNVNVLPKWRMHGTEVTPSPWQRPPDSDAGTAATLSVAIVAPLQKKKDKCSLTF